MLRLIAFFSLLVISLTYELRPVVKDGMLGFTNITTAPFLKIGNSYYYIETKLEKNWYDAYATCRLIESELITIDSIEEWKWVNEYLKAMNIDDQPYWTSGTDLALKGNHVWFSNGKNITLTDIWYPGEPNNNEGNENCDEMSFSPNNNTKGLNDLNCETPRRYICKPNQPQMASIIVW